MMADETRPGFRGKCLYKTGKCNNERALKTSGQSHNLCDEHRHRQNEHQRKLDAKNRYARKDKNEAQDGSPTNAMAAAAAAAASATGSQRHRYMPYGKMRMSPNGGNGTTTQDDVHALLGRSGVVPTSMMQFHNASMGGGGGSDGSASSAAAMASQMVGVSMPSGSPEILPSGVVILPNGPQAPQMPHSMAMQDFDGIVVPLPSYLEGHERVEFRSRIYQKVLDFIAEECMRRFGAPPAVVLTNNGINNSHVSPPAPPPPPSSVDAAAAVNGDSRNSSEGTSTSAAPEEPTNVPRPDNENKKEKEGTSPHEAHEDDGKDSEDTLPEDAEEDLAPRSKRGSRPRVNRKEV